MHGGNDAPSLGLPLSDCSIQSFITDAGMLAATGVHERDQCLDLKKTRGSSLSLSCIDSSHLNTEVVWIDHLSRQNLKGRI